MPPETEPAAPAAAPPAAAPPTTYETLKAAAQQAVAKHNADHPESAPAGEDQPPGQDPVAEPSPVLAPAGVRLKKLLDARGDAQRVRDEANQIASRERQEAQRERAEAQRELAAAKQERERFARFRADPSAGASEMGIDPAAMVDQLARGNSPEAQLARWKHDLETKSAERESAWASELKSIKDELTQERQAKQSQARGASEQGFVKAASDEEKYPAANVRWTSAEIVREGYRVIEQVKKRCADEGKAVPHCTDDDILSYLEDEAREWVNKTSSKFSSVSERVRSQQSGKALQGQRAKGQRTLTAQAGSERRATPKAIADMTEAERDQAARAAAREALKTR